jgi:hypothetical protein
MMLNHINLCSSNVPALTHTLDTHFGYRTVQAGTVLDEPWATDPGSHFAMLIGTDGSNLVITQIDPVPGGTAYPTGFHFGIIQDSPDAVTSKHDELAAAGLNPGPISTFDALGATWTAFTCPLGDGLEVEINHRSRSELLDAPTSPR